MAKYFLIGELHGNNESPQACWDIIQRYGIKNLAIEADLKYQQEVDEYLSSQKNIEQLSLWSLDHLTKAVKNLVHKAKENGMKIYCVDDWSCLNKQDESVERDKAMAENLKKIKGNVAYLCGGDHASKKPILIDKNSEWFSVYKNGLFLTCGSFLPKSKTISFLICALNGGRSFFNGKVQMASKFNLPGNRIKNLPMIIPSIKDGYDYLYIFDKYTSSV